MDDYVNHFAEDFDVDPTPRAQYEVLNNFAVPSKKKALKNLYRTLSTYNRTSALPSANSTDFSKGLDLPKESLLSKIGLKKVSEWIKAHTGPDGKAVFDGVNLPSIGQFGKDLRGIKLTDNLKLSGAANALSGVYQGGTAIKNGIDLSNSSSDLDSLKKDILASAASNDIASSYLTSADQLALRKLKRGDTGVNQWGGAMSGIMSNLPKTLASTAIGGLTGGGLGAAIGGIGSLVNSGLSGANNVTQERSAALQNLYNNLLNAETNYNGERSSRMRNRYFNTYY
ncbi:hypothetical protein [Paratractidigestivibacter sp.]|uniref:hypothetical protein n=1 Tax=Paratractidigestivibacter sp. TaxID=2847316 RepID=UPI002ACB09C8|nr:hypothetical protein [Paratractidigestivibacter sp.]